MRRILWRVAAASPVPKLLSLGWPARAVDKYLTGYKLQQEALGLVPGGTRVLFDIGCGGAAYHKRNGKVNVIGLDANPKRLEVARNYCDTILLHDLTKNLPVIDADCVLCLEVIEHLPLWAGQRLLCQLSRYPVVILSTPRDFFRVRRNGYEAHLSHWTEAMLGHYGYDLVLECKVPPSNIYRRGGHEGE